MAKLESKSGTYIVVLKSGQTESVQIGKHAQLEVCKGYYAYIGSAMGPGGVAARLKHHRKVSERPHWHLDYLRAVTDFHEVYALYSPERKECQWATLMAKSEGVSEPLKGFGSSDCGCNTHLFYFRSYKAVARAIRNIPMVCKQNAGMYKN